MSDRRVRVLAAIDAYGEVPALLSSWRTMIADAIDAAFAEPAEVPAAVPATAGGPLTVYISIDNSDDLLGQADWNMFCMAVGICVRSHARIVHGQWFSNSSARQQNACWCVEVAPEGVAVLREKLRQAAAAYSQESIGWAVAQFELLTAGGDGDA